MIRDDPTTRLTTLQLSNFRGFRTITLQFHPRLTVLVARNGGGKTAVLDAAAIALRLFVDTMNGVQTSKGFDAKDIRLVRSPDNTMEEATPVRFNAQGLFLNTFIGWSRERRSRNASRTTTVEAQELRLFADELILANLEWAQKKNAERPLFPLISYYGTGRLWSATKLTQGKKISESAPTARARGYIDCLISSSHYNYFIDWFRRFSYEAQQERTSNRASSHTPQQLLSAVRAAVDSALQPSGWHSLEWDFAEDTARANHPIYGQLPVNMLSDGIRNMIGLVADIAHRAARLNAHLGSNAAKRTPGIVLIDEVDMHLHAEWQQQVLSSLQEAFPLIQFIVTTHSPQVLTTLRKENIRILTGADDGAWTAGEPATSPLAHEAGDALATILNTHPRPEIAGILPDIRRYEELVRTGRGNSEDAQQIRSRLDSAGFEFSDAERALFDFLSRRAAETNNT